MPSYTVRAVEDAGPYEGVIGGLLHIGRRGEGGTFKDKMDAAAAQPPRSELKGSAVQTKMDATAA